VNNTDVPTIISVMVWVMIGVSATITIGIILAYIFRALGLIFEDGCIYGTKKFLDIEICVFSIQGGKYERPKGQKRCTKARTKQRAKIIPLTTKYS
jgi:hypothetical protein